MPESFPASDSGFLCGRTVREDYTERGGGAMSRRVDAFIVFAIYFVVLVAFIIKDSYKFLLLPATVIMTAFACDAAFVIASHIW